MLVGVKRILVAFFKKITSSLSEIYIAKDSAVNLSTLTVWKGPGAIQKSGNRMKLTIKIPARLGKLSMRRHAANRISVLNCPGI